MPGKCYSLVGGLHVCTRDAVSLGVSQCVVFTEGSVGAETSLVSMWALLMGCVDLGGGVTSGSTMTQAKPNGG